MKKAQKIIKYLAIAFGLYLAINIIGGIVFGATLLLGIDMGLNAISEVTEVTVMDYEESFTNIEKLDIKINAADFEIKVGEELKVVLKDVNEKAEVKAQGKTLKITDAKVKWNMVSNINPSITLYIPEGMTFKETKIEMGAGVTNIESLNTDNLQLELGAGQVLINNCTAKQSDIDCGAGKVEIKNAKLEDLELNTGIGECSFNGYILGKSDIECGIGKLILDLEGGKDLYSIKANHGIGAITINGEKVKENETVGSGENKIKIEGGIGEIQIKM